MSILIGIIAIIVGAIYTFLGYNLFRILLPIWGLFAGAAIGWTGTTQAFGTGFVATIIAIIIAILIALIFAALSWFFYSLAIVILGASLGYSLSIAILNSLGIDFVITNVMVGIVGAIILGTLAYAYNIRKYIVVLLTATAGASLIVVGLLVLLGRVEVAELQHAQILNPIIKERFLWWSVWAVLAILGIIQQALTRGRDWFEDYSYDTAVKKS